MKLIRALKRHMYFLVASYFGFWAGLHLRRWGPTVVAAVGSSGKTTLLHLLAAELGDKAKISYKANSAFGIPFNILGLERKSFGFFEWPIFAVLAPFKSLLSVPNEKIYVAEADAERPGEGRFLARLLKPGITVWLSLEEAHGVNYDRIVESDAPDVTLAVKKEMAHEFGYFVEYAKGSAILNKDNPFIVSESGRTHSAVEWISESDVKAFNVRPRAVEITSSDGSCSVPALIPPQAAISAIAALRVMKALGLTKDPSFKGFILPPGRSSVFNGVKGTTIIDSTYNATIGGMEAMIGLMKAYPASGEKWLVLGDMIEQGKSEKGEHQLLAEMIKEASPKKVILVGPRLQETTYPILLSSYGKDRVASFLMPAEALDYIKKEIKGGETILFKGARFLEGVVEKLLANPADAALLCRREAVWARRRSKWGV